MGFTPHALLGGMSGDQNKKRFPGWEKRFLFDPVRPKVRLTSFWGS